MSAADVPPRTDVAGRDVPRRAYVPWSDAWAAALYGPAGFYRRPEGPAGHFRTASHAAPDLLAAALARLARRAGCDRVVDVGAGRGELLAALARIEGRSGCDPPVLHGCDVVDRPAGLPARIGWSTGLDALPDAVLDGALVVGWELLDVVPGPVVEVDGAGVPRLVLVDPATGDEVLGTPVGGPDAAWLDGWWPLAGSPPGTRAEVGRARDRLWAGLAGRCRATPRGAVLLAVDYAHTRDARPAGGSLAGYRAGRLVRPVPDGSCDVTAHVALDAVAAAAQRAGASPGPLVDQRTALRALGVAGPLPGPASRVAADVLRALAERSAAAELVDPAGLGGFSWSLQAVGRPVPALLPAGPSSGRPSPADPLRQKGSRPPG